MLQNGVLPARGGTSLSSIFLPPWQRRGCAPGRDRRTSWCAPRDYRKARPYHPPDGRAANPVATGGSCEAARPLHPCCTPPLHSPLTSTSRAYLAGRAALAGRADAPCSCHHGRSAFGGVPRRPAGCVGCATGVGVPLPSPVTNAATSCFRSKQRSVQITRPPSHLVARLYKGLIESACQACGVTGFSSASVSVLRIPNIVSFSGVFMQMSLMVFSARKPALSIGSDSRREIHSARQFNTSSYAMKRSASGSSGL